MRSWAPPVKMLVFALLLGYQRRVAVGTTYHLAPGEDPQPVGDVLQAGDTLIYDPGTHCESLDLKSSGQRGTPITIIGHGATLDGSCYPTCGGIKSCEHAFDTQGHDFIDIEGFTFTDWRAAVLIRPGSQHIAVRNIQAFKHDFAIWVSNKDVPKVPNQNAEVTDVTISNAIIMGDRDFGPRGDGIRIGEPPEDGTVNTNGVLIENVNVSGFSYLPERGDYTQGDSVICEIGSSNVTIRNSVLHGIGDTGADRGDAGVDNKGENTVIDGVTIFNCKNGIKNHDQGSITVCSTAIYDIRADQGTTFPEGVGINAQGGGVTVTNTTIINSEVEDLRNDGDAQAQLNNSIVARWLPIGQIGSGFSTNHVILFDANKDPQANDPQFVDRNAGNFRLLLGSPAIDAGDADLVTCLTDRDGRPRVQGAGVDLGAYEYQITGSTVQITLVSNPPDVPLKLDGQTVAGPVNSQVGSQHAIEAPLTATIGGSDYVFSSWSDGGAATHPIITPSTNMTYTATYTPVSVLPPFQQSTGPDHIVMMEAESYHNNVSQGAHSWTDYTATPGYSGANALQATPNTGDKKDLPSEYLTGSPRLDFRIKFVATGVHYVWVRGLGHSFADDSVHTGLDGQAVSTADRIDGFTTSYGWTNGTLDQARATINVANAGIHTLNLWMREDGTIVDKLLLTTDPSFVPDISPFDFDGDNDVDQDDFAIFAACESGPAIPHNGTETCQLADIDNDNDIDQVDFGALQRCYSGAVIAADPTCTQ